MTKLDIEIPQPQDIRELRNKLRITQEELALRTDVSTRQIIAVERGERPMDRKHWFVMRMLFDDSYLLSWLRKQMRLRPRLARALHIKV